MDKSVACICVLFFIFVAILIYNQIVLTKSYIEEKNKKVAPQTIIIEKGYNHPFYRNDRNIHPRIFQHHNQHNHHNNEKFQNRRHK